MLNDLKPPVKQSNCKVRSIAESLDEKDRKIFYDAVGDLPNWPARTLSVALQDRSIMISDLSITKHRQKRCSC